MDKDSELEYLMNPVLYDKYKQLSSKANADQLKIDKRFYRKRINQMAKDAQKDLKCVPPHLNSCYNEFARQCIAHFRCQDETDGLQEEYTNIEALGNTTCNDNIILPEDINKLDTSLLGKQQKKVLTMADFVKKTNTVPVVQPIIPKQRVVNTKEEKYRTKGVRKNKSID